VIGICAAGILIRAVAPRLADKHGEPPLIAVAADGSSVVPLLGGHHGANLLSRRIAAVLQGIPAITTAGDLAFGLGLDEPPEGYTLANPEDAKGLMANLLRGGGLRIEGDAPWLADSNLPLSADGRMVIEVTHRAVEGSTDHLVYHPRNIAIGVGCERNAKPVELIRLVQTTLAEHGIARDSIAGVYSLDLKADEPAMQELARWLGVPFRVFDAAAILKLGRHGPRVIELLNRLHLADRARYIERATMTEQRILPLSEVDPSAIPYFAMIVVHRKGRQHFMEFGA
jgi:cobalt-precorrin 5A hydrolase/precorrin-3B C17-methyltransferase